MKDRIKTIRKEVAKLNQVDFGARIGITGAAVSWLESGVRSASNTTVLSICREWNISEHWLRTGEGQIHIEPTAAEKIAQLLAQGNYAKAMLYSAIAALPDYLLVDLRREIRRIMRSLPQPPEEE